jgi:hypothetical protein
MEYEIRIVFIRDVADDKGVLKAKRKKFNADTAMVQMVKELQDAFNEGMIGGRFHVESVKIDGRTTEYGNG